MSKYEPLWDFIKETGSDCYILSFFNNIIYKLETRTILDRWLEEYNQSDCYRFGIELKESQQLIGMLDVVVTITDFSFCVH